MSSAPLGRRLEMFQRATREEARDRRTIVKVHLAASALLLVSTLLAWENHPRVKFIGGPHPGYFVVEASHSIGLATRPAGLIAVAVAVLSLVVANLLRRMSMLVGWLAVLVSCGVLGTCFVEIVQLLLGRRNWLDFVASNVQTSTLGQAVGRGVWLATLASVALVVNALTYLWLEYRLWRNNPAVRA